MQFSAPQATAIAALMALIGAAVGAVITGFFELKVREQQLQSNLVLKAIDIEDESDAAKRLKFFAKAGLVPRYKEDIIKLAEQKAIPALKKPAFGTIPRRDQLHQTILVLADGTPIPGEKWEVERDFIRKRDGKTEHDMSGAACQSPQRCVLVGNSARHVYFFALSEEQVIRARDKTVYLAETDLNAKKTSQLDLEAVSYDDGHYLFVGSHSVKLTPKDDIPECRLKERHGLYLIQEDPVLGEFTASTVGKPPADLKTASLDYFFEQNDYFKPYYNELLQFGGINIEGATLVGRKIYIGMRAPTLDGRAFVLKLDRDALFGGQTPEPEVLGLQFDRMGIGIRDMAKIDQGFLLLVGDSEAEEPNNRIVACGPRKGDKISYGSNVGNPFELYFWDGRNGSPSLLGTIFGTFTSIVDKVKAEGLLVLPEPWSNSDELAIMIWFDGIENGAPMSYKIPQRILAKKGP